MTALVYRVAAWHYVVEAGNLRASYDTREEANAAAIAIGVRRIVSVFYDKTL